MDNIRYKKISISESVYNRLLEDKKNFTKDIGINFTFSSTLNEYHKILDGIKNER